jgi:hypothetical protein
MRTPALGKLVADSWTAAEDGVWEKVTAQYRDSDEEFITGLVRGELESSFDRVIGELRLETPKRNPGEDRRVLERSF